MSNRQAISGQGEFKHEPSDDLSSRAIKPKRQAKSEKSHTQLLELVFREADNHDDGLVDKSMLPPILCRTDSMKLWCQVLNSHQYVGITKVTLRWCAIQSSGAKLLAEGLVNSCVTSLVHLDLMGNEIGVSGSRAIASIMAPGIDLDSYQHADKSSRDRPNSALRVLIMSSNSIADGGCNYIGKGITLSSTIYRLELESCEIGDNGCKYLRRGIERNNTLKKLNLACNRFGDSGVKEIQTFLLRNSSLEKLDISRNRLGATRTTDIAKGLTMNRSLRILRMNINRIGARGAQVLAKMLVNNSSLQELELSYNEVFNDGVQVLAQGLAQNHGLQRVVLWYNGLEDSAARHLAKALLQRSQRAFFRDAMTRAVADSRPYWFYQFNPDSKKQEPKNVEMGICEQIIDFLPVFMHFEVDLSHNRRISKQGISALTDLADSHRVEIRGLKESLGKDRREREAAALARTSLY